VGLTFADSKRRKGDELSYTGHWSQRASSCFNPSMQCYTANDDWRFQFYGKTAAQSPKVLWRKTRIKSYTLYQLSYTALTLELRTQWIFWGVLSNYSLTPAVLWDALSREPADIF